MGAPDGPFRRPTRIPWCVRARPGALLGAPLAIILLVVLAQAIAGMILVPVTRRVLRRDDVTLPTVPRAGSFG